MDSRLLFLTGPTAAGKTALAVELVERYPFEIISVDSALVYRGMDIGTAKPDAETLRRAPHRLIDLIEPTDSYSAARFREDALQAIEEIRGNGKIPLLVGGTMLYYRALQFGLSRLPESDPDVRQQLEQRRQESGLASLYQQLQQLDPEAATKINANDPQRILRALEVYEVSGTPMSQLQREQRAQTLSDSQVTMVAINPKDRSILHQRIEQRFGLMLEQGLIEEVEKLMQRGDLSPDLPSMRSVGYRQVWEYLEGRCDHEEMAYRATVATRQLAKRQLTWLRNWPTTVEWIDPQQIKGMAEQLYLKIRA